MSFLKPLFVLTSYLILSATPLFASQNNEDSRVSEIVEKLWESLGGKQAWQEARQLSFHWVAARDGKDLADYRHDWDRWQGNYRLEGTDREGKHFVTIFNLKTTEGDVYLEGEKVTVDSTRAKFLELAYGRYINDSYWLIMPYKLQDPGVNLVLDGEKVVKGKKCDVLKLTFESVGLTPGDTYWVFVDREGSLVRRWEYCLEGWPEDRERSASNWEDWRTFNGIKLALSKPFDGRDVRIYFRGVSVLKEADHSIFKQTGKTF